MKPEDFRREAEKRFGFLTETGFFGPEEGAYWVSYTTGVLGVEIHYDDLEAYVATVVHAAIGLREPRAGLDCLYVTAKLGSAQDMRHTARSAKLLGPVLGTHVAALRKVLPILQSADGPELLFACHGR